MDTHNSNKQVTTAIRHWLIKSGYPLELYAYEHLVKAGYFCEKSALYTDPELTVEREIDIVGERSYQSGERHSFSVELLVECKKSEKPLLVLAFGPETAPVRSEIYGARVWPSEFSNAELLAEIGSERDIFSEALDLPFSKQVRSGYSVVQAFTTSDEKFHKVLYGLAKAEHYFEAMHEQSFRNATSAEEHRDLPVMLQVCLLVIDAPLFNVYLNKGELEIEETDWASVTLNLPWIPRPQSERRANIQIVTKRQLAVFLSELESFSRWLAASGIIESRAKQLFA